MIQNDSACSKIPRIVPTPPDDYDFTGQDFFESRLIPTPQDGSDHSYPSLNFQTLYELRNDSSAYRSWITESLSRVHRLLQEGFEPVYRSCKLKQTPELSGIQNPSGRRSSEHNIEGNYPDLKLTHNGLSSKSVVYLVPWGLSRKSLLLTGFLLMEHLAHVENYFQRCTNQANRSSSALGVLPRNLSIQTRKRILFMHQCDSPHLSGNFIPEALSTRR